MKYLAVLFCLFLGGDVAGQMVDSVAVAKEVDSLLNVSKTLRENRKYHDALSIGQLAMDITKKTWGENNVTYALCIHRLAMIYERLIQYDKAEDFYLKAIDLRGKILGKENKEYAHSLNNLAIIYHQKGDGSNAETFYLEAKEVYAKTLGKNHSSYGSALNNLAILYQDRGDYLKAEAFYLEALEIEKLRGKDNEVYASKLSSLATLYADKSDFLKAEPMYKEAIGILAKTSGEEDLTYVYAINGLGNLYNDIGDYQHAEQLFLRAIDINSKILDRNHPDYTLPLNGLANVYSTKGDYERAERLYLECVENISRIQGKLNPNYALALYSLANHYRIKGDFEKAWPLFLEAKEINGKVLGKEHKDFARSLNSLAVLLFENGDYTKAEPLYLEASAIWKKAFGEENPDYAYSVENLANLYREKNEYAKAEPLYLEAKEIRSKSLGKEHPDYAVSLSNLAVMYLAQGEYSKATPLCLEAIDIQKKVLGVEHQDYSKSLNSLADLYHNTNQIPACTKTFLELQRLDSRLIAKAATYSSENQMLAYMRTFEINNCNFLSLTQSHPTDSLRISAYDNALFFNNALLGAAIARENGIARADSSIRELHAEWKSCHFQLNNWYQKSIIERDSGIVARLEEKAEQLEKELVRHSPEFAESRREIHWDEVRDKLHPGDVALEFISFRWHNAREVTDSVMYAALLLHPGDTAPAFIPLFEEKQIKAILEPGDRKDDRKYFADVYRNLHQLLWQNIGNKLLPEDSVIYYAPAGELHKINLEALYDAQLHPLSDRYRFVRLGSTRQIVTRKSKPNTYGQGLTAVVYGGIQYEADSLALSNAVASVRANTSSESETSIGYSASFPADSLLAERRGGGDLDSFAPLPQSLTEAQHVRDLLRKKGFQTILRTGFEANEEHFKQLGDNLPAPRVLHVATHGFFFPNSGENPQKRSLSGDEEVVPFKIHEQPMMRGGLALAGANRMWLQRRPYSGLEDGILTAYEISHLNLKGTELAVFSACETNLGDIAGSEGVFGLQRALKIAGAQRLIMSLWEVPSSQTQLLFSQFYENWVQRGMEIPEAFRAAQKTLRKKYPNPFFWAGFVLVE